MSHNRSNFFSSPAFNRVTEQKANDSYQQFMSKPSKPLSQPNNVLATILPDPVHSVIHMGKEAVVHGAESAIPGLGTTYLLPKIAAIDVTIGSYKRINQQLEKGKSSISTMVCGIAGATAETATTVAGGMLVTSATIAVTTGTGGAGIVAGVPLFASGFSIVNGASKQVGNLTEQACHATFTAFSKPEPKPLLNVRKF